MGACCPAHDHAQDDEFEKQLSNDKKLDKAGNVQVKEEARWGWEAQEQGVTQATRASYSPNQKGEVKKRNQDLCKVWKAWNGHTDQLLAIMLDGHGRDGENFSDLTMTALEKHLKNSTYIEADPKEAFCDAFKKTDEDMLKHGEISNWGSEGACAAVVLQRGSRIYVANCGDCRVTLARQKIAKGFVKTDDGKTEDVTTEDVTTEATADPVKAVEKKGILGLTLTQDHTPVLDTERERIVKSKGKVAADKGGTLRVYSGPPIIGGDGIAISRTFGNGSMRQWGVISDPYTYDCELSATDLFVVLTTDGVSDIIDTQQIVESVHESFTANGSSGVEEYIQATGHIWENTEGFDNGGYVDDATMCVVCLSTLGTGFETV